jgi:hypothetical protein
MRRMPANIRESRRSHFFFGNAKELPLNQPPTLPKYNRAGYPAELDYPLPDTHALTY